MQPLVIAIAYLTVVICIAIAYILLSEYYESYRALRHVPGPKNYPFVGSMWVYKNLPAEERFKWLNDLCFTFKNGMVVTWFNTEPVVNVRKPHQIQVILSNSRLLTKSMFYKYLGRWLENGLITTTSDEGWCDHRHIMTSVFDCDALDEYTSVIHDKVEILTGIIQTKIENCSSTSVDIFNMIMRYTLDTKCEIALGVDLNIQRHPENEYVKHLHNCCQTSKNINFRSWMKYDFIFYKTRTGKEFCNSVEYLKKMTKKVIKERHHQTCFQDNKQFDKCGKLKKKAFVDVLLDVNQLNHYPLTLEEIRQEVDTFIFAGHDSTAAAIIWTLFVLGNDSNAQTKVRAELIDTFGYIPERPTIQQLDQLPYLDRAIKEVLRLYPCIPLISRLLDHDLIIDNRYIPKKTMVHIQVYQLHHDPEIWENPEIFDPDRFLPENHSKKHQLAYMPFSHGTRSCVGQRFAALEVKIVVIKMLRLWNIKSALKSTEVKLVSDSILRPFGDKVDLYFTPINK